MKNVLILLTILFTLVSCSKDDENIMEEPQLSNEEIKSSNQTVEVSDLSIVEEKIGKSYFIRYRVSLKNTSEKSIRGTFQFSYTYDENSKFVHDVEPIDAGCGLLIPNDLCSFVGTTLGDTEGLVKQENIRDVKFKYNITEVLD